MIRAVAFVALVAFAAWGQSSRNATFLEKRAAFSSEGGAVVSGSGGYTVVVLPEIGPVPLAPPNERDAGYAATFPRGAVIADDGDWLFALAERGGVAAIDLRDAYPEVSDFLDFDSPIKKLYLSGSRLWALTAEGVAVAIDVGDPTRPETLGAVAPKGGARDMATNGTAAVVAAGDQGVRVLDVGDPTAPEELGSFATEGAAIAVEFRGETVVASDDAGYLYIIALADPAHPKETARVALKAPAHDLALDRRFAYAACGEAGLRIIDVSNTVAPVERGWYDPSAEATSVVAERERLFLKTADGATYILRNDLF